MASPAAIAGVPAQPLPRSTRSPVAFDERQSRKPASGCTPAEVHTALRLQCDHCLLRSYPLTVSQKVRTHAPLSVSLRPLAQQDLPTLFAIQQDPAGGRLAGVLPRDRAGFDLAMERAMSDPAFTVRAIIADGGLAGSMACFKRDGRDFIGYWLAREHWGRGIATRAVMLLIEERAARPLYARVARHNIASLRVLLKCGFRVMEYRWLPGSERDRPGVVALLSLA